MHRRQMIVLLASTPATWAGAADEWKPFLGKPPIYLEGEVTVLTWAAPAPSMELVHRRGAKIPADLAAREIAPHKSRERIVALLRNVVLPASTDRVWRIRLPTLPQLLAWGMQRPKIGELVGVVVYAGPAIDGTQALEAEVLFTGPRGYPLRSERL